MCGIFGFFGNTTGKENLLCQCSNKISHRGPDSNCNIIKNNMFLSFYRLAINDLTSNGDQPFDIDGCLLMCNGEIYNWKDLKEKYNIENMKSTSDCEIIIHLYKKIGIKQTLLELDGYFALILVDKINNLIHIGRDRLGVRSLYIGIDDDCMIAASELKAIHDFSETIKINQFPPSSYQTWDFNIKLIKEEKYYEHIYCDNNDTEEEVMVKIRELMEKAVRKRLMSERKFCVTLSGGVDSSLVASLLVREMKKMGYTNKLDTFSIGLKDSVDLKHARIVAEFLETNHHEIIITEQDLIDNVENVIKQIESIDTTTIRSSCPMYLLCKYISENTDIKVIFNGENSDEIFAAYLYFHDAPNNIELRKENERLLLDMYNFDIIRADKCISKFGLEGRFAFMDNDVVSYVMSINSNFKMPKNNPLKIEKYLLRKAYTNDNYLPHKIVWRVKDGMSDGISGIKEGYIPWYKSFDNINFDENEFKDMHCKPILKESMYYRKIFNKYYKNCQHIIPHFWMPKWNENLNDPSGRLLPNYK